MPTPRRPASPCGSARLAPLPPAPDFRRGGYQGGGACIPPFQSKTPFARVLEGAKGVFEAAFAGNAGSAQRCACAILIPLFPRPAKSPVTYRLAKRSFRGYRARFLPMAGLRSSGRVVEGARLESVYTSKAYRGFESLLLRHLPGNLGRSCTLIGIAALPPCARCAAWPCVDFVRSPASDEVCSPCIAQEPEVIRPHLLGHDLAPSITDVSPCALHFALTSPPVQQ